MKGETVSRAEIDALIRGGNGADQVARQLLEGFAARLSHSLCATTGDACTIVLHAVHRDWTGKEAPGDGLWCRSSAEGQPELHVSYHVSNELVSVIGPDGPESFIQAWAAPNAAGMEHLSQLFGYPIVGLPLEAEEPGEGKHVAGSFELTFGGATGTILVCFTAELVEAAVVAAASVAAAASSAETDPALGNESPSDGSYRAAAFPDLTPGTSRDDGRNIGLLLDVTLLMTVELGRTRRQIREVLNLSPGSILELDKLAGEQVDVLVNGKLIAKGEVVVIDENYGVRISDIISPADRMQSLK